MGWLEDMTEAVAARDSLRVSSLMHDFARCPMGDTLLEKPELPAERLPLAAAIADLLTKRSGARAPAWTSSVGALEQPFYALAYALRVPRLREQCERESPAELRRRNVFAPSQFLTVA